MLSSWILHFVRELKLFGATNSRFTDLTKYMWKCILFNCYAFKIPVNMLVVSTKRVPSLKCLVEIISWNIIIKHIFFIQGSTYEDETNNINFVISKINKIMAHNSPILIIQRWIRGYLVRKILRYVYFLYYLNIKLKC